MIAAALSALMLTGAHATDVYSQPSMIDGTPAPSYVPAKINWSGFYIGGRIGYGNANHDLTVQRYNGGYCYDTFGDAAEFPDGFDPRDPGNQENNIFGDPRVRNVPEGESCEDLVTTDTSGPTNYAGQYFPVDPSSQNELSLDGLNSHGIIGGGQIGADQQMGRIVVGVFGSYDLNGMETNISAEDGFGIEGNGQAFDVNSLEKGDEWSLGARVGFLATPRTMVYALAAYTQTDYTVKGTRFADGENPGAFSKTTDFDGVSVGGGIEIALTSNVFLGGEYVHTFYGKETILDTGGTNVGGFGTRVIDDLDEDKIMGTLKIKLNSDLSKLY